MLVATFVGDQEIGNPNGKTATKMKNYILKFYNTVLPRIVNELKMGGFDIKDVTEFKNHTEAVAMKFNFISKPKMQQNQGGGQTLTPEQIQQLMQSQQ